MMKKRVRVLPLLLVVVLCLSLFAGCGKKKPEQAAGAASSASTFAAVTEATVEAVVAATDEASAQETASSLSAASTEAAMEASVASTLSTATEADASTGRSEEAAASFKSATGSGGSQKTESSKTDTTSGSSGLFKSEKVERPVNPPDEADAHPTDSGNSSGKSATKDKAQTTKAAIDETGTYTSKDDVALYIHTYGKLPSNFITKKEANALGWSGGSLEKYAPGKSIGGDKFGNYEGLLPTAKGRKYYECDIDTLGKSKRGAKRIIFSSDGLIYYTSDHYESFEQLY